MRVSMPQHIFILITMKFQRMIGFPILFISAITAQGFTVQNPESTPLALSSGTEGLIIGSCSLLNLSTIARPPEDKTDFFRGNILDRSVVNDIDRILMYPFSPSLDTISTMLSFATLASPAILVAAPRSEWVTLGVIYLEAVGLSWALKELGKSLVPRYRPYMYFPGYPEKDVESGEFCQSFPSGHTALAFTGAAFCAYTLPQYFGDAFWVMPAVVGSYALAVSTGILRVVSGNHFFTDALVGAAIGTISGLVVPYLHSRHGKKSGSFVLLPGMISLSLRW